MKKLGLVFALFAAGGMLALATFFGFFMATRDDVAFINLAGRQRYRAQQLLYFSEYAMKSDAEDRDLILHEISRFDQALQVLRNGGTDQGHAIQSASPFILGKLTDEERVWASVRPALLEIANLPAGSKARSAAFAAVQKGVPKLVEAADEVVMTYQARDDVLRLRILVLLGGILVLDLALMGIGFFVTRCQIVYPLSRIEAAIEAFRRGDLSFRLEVASKDEISDLAAAFNEASSEIARLMHALAAKERQQRLLAELMTPVSDHLSYYAVIEKVIQNLVPEWADWVMVDLVQENGSPRRAFVVHRDPSKRPLSEELKNSYSPLTEESFRLLQVLRTGRAIMISDVHEENLEQIARRPRQRELLRLLGTRSIIVVPLIARGRTLGAISLVRSGEVFDDENLHLAEDIGRRVALVADNARLFEEARKAAAVREDLLAVVSHDLKNPLASIKIGAGAMRIYLGDQTLQGEEMRRKLEFLIDGIDTCVRSATRLIQDLLDFAQIQSGTLLVEKRLSKVDRIIDEALSIVDPQAREKGIHLIRESPPAIEVPCDESRVVQALLNLLGNSIKFTGRGGHVTIRVEEREDDVRIQVEDDGPGIEPENLPHVFDRYWQARNMRRKGTGLGLSIVKGIVESHGGTVEVESMPGKGSCFSFTLPKGVSFKNSAA